MYGALRFRRLLGLAFLAFVLLPSVASAWVETAVRSHHARVVVDRDGRAEVRHELGLKLRGGPLEVLEVPGVGAGIEILPDAIVRRSEAGSAARWPLEVTATESGDLRLRVVDERGLRGGSFVFEFGYHISLVERGWFEKTDAGVRLAFVGPRLSTGVDAARVTFVVPAAEPAPVLLMPADGAAGALLSQVRRGAQGDEIELVRAHLAVAEPALWQILASPQAFSAAPSALAPALQSVPVVERSLEKRSFIFWHALVALALSGAFGALVLAKARAYERAAAVRRARSRPLLPSSPVARAVVAGVFVGASAWTALVREPTWSAVLACGALLFTTFLLPTRLTLPRGPGEWKKLDPAKISREAALPGSSFEIGTPRGFLVFLALLGGTAVAAYRLLGTSTYLSLMAAAGALLFLPLFWTGRRRDLPEPPESQGQKWFRYLQKKLDVRVCQVELWGRCPLVDVDASSGSAFTADFVGDVAAPARGELSAPAPDEVRIRFVPERFVSGLRAVEVVLEEGAGSFVSPCVLVRVLEDSDAARRLPRDFPWIRGRTAEEKVAIVRPTAPTPRQLLRLVRSVIVALTRSSESPSSDSNVEKSAGSGAQTSKGATVAPLAAT